MELTKSSIRETDTGGRFFMTSINNHHPHNHHHHHHICNNSRQEHHYNHHVFNHHHHHHPIEINFIQTTTTKTTTTYLSKKRLRENKISSSSSSSSYCNNQTECDEYDDVEDELKEKESDYESFNLNYTSSSPTAVVDKEILEKENGSRRNSGVKHIEYQQQHFVNINNIVNNRSHYHDNSIVNNNNNNSLENNNNNLDNNNINNNNDNDNDNESSIKNTFHLHQSSGFSPSTANTLLDQQQIAAYCNIKSNIEEHNSNSSSNNIYNNNSHSSSPSSSFLCKSSPSKCSTHIHHNSTDHRPHKKYLEESTDFIYQTQQRRLSYDNNINNNINNNYIFKPAQFRNSFDYIPNSDEEADDDDEDDEIKGIININRGVQINNIKQEEEDENQLQQHQQQKDQEEEEEEGIKNNSFQNALSQFSKVKIFDEDEPELLELDLPTESNIDNNLDFEGDFDHFQNNNRFLNSYNNNNNRSMNPMANYLEKKEIKFKPVIFK